MELDDLQALLGRRQFDSDTTIEPSRTQQSRVEDVRSVGGCQIDDAFGGLEPVQFGKQLVERLLALVVSASQPGAAVAADRVQLVDKDDAGPGLLGYSFARLFPVDRMF